jgi:hypothetical protein
MIHIKRYNLHQIQRKKCGLDNREGLIYKEISCILVVSYFLNSTYIITMREEIVGKITL